VAKPNIFLHTFDSDMASAWQRDFADVKDVKVVEGDILIGACDAIVSPANSFGYMDGGIDLAYLRFFGQELQSRVQERIKGGFHGELPVGQATIVATRHEMIPFLVAAPTMRIPDRIGSTVNVYLAFRAALLAVLAHNDETPDSIRTLRTPALGTGVGSMPLTRAAHQMRAAYASVFENPDWLSDPASILVHHEQLRSG
jgi:O-acetyl-ADP-ribose deacetylase (regulator of RNase III)